MQSPMLANMSATTRLSMLMSIPTSSHPETQRKVEGLRRLSLHAVKELTTHVLTIDEGFKECQDLSSMVAQKSRVELVLALKKHLAPFPAPTTPPPVVPAVRELDPKVQRFHDNTDSMVWSIQNKLNIISVALRKCDDITKMTALARVVRAMKKLLEDADPPFIFTPAPAAVDDSEEQQHTKVNPVIVESRRRGTIVAGMEVSIINHHPGGSGSGDGSDPSSPRDAQDLNLLDSLLDGGPMDASAASSRTTDADGTSVDDAHGDQEDVPQMPLAPDVMKHLGEDYVFIVGEGEVRNRRWKKGFLVLTASTLALYGSQAKWEDGAKPATSCEVNTIYLLNPEVDDDELAKLKRQYVVDVSFCVSNGGKERKHRWMLSFDKADERAMWCLALDALVKAGTFDTLMRPKVRHRLLHDTFKEPFVGMLPSSLTFSDGEEWKYTPAKALMKPVGAVGKYSDDATYFWDGQYLKPKVDAPWGHSRWNGVLLTWYDPSDRPVLQYVWNDVEKCFVCTDITRKWKITKNFMSASVGRDEWVKSAPLPDVLVMSLQLMRYAREAMNMQLQWSKTKA